MASAGGKEVRQPGLSVKQGSKLHSKLLSKEAAAQFAAPSFRVYYSVASAGAVPFLWESQPGTPKNDSPSAAALPPLTPPPSYYTAGSRGGGRGGGGSKERRRPGAIFPWLTLLRRRGHTAPCSASSSQSSSSSSSSMSPVFTVQSSPACGHRRTFSADADEETADDAAARCYEMDRECCENGIVKGCGVAVSIRNALATVVGGKPGRRATTSAAAA